MRVAVTGATGFLGSSICRRLRASGYDVTGLGRNREIGATLEARNIRFLEADLAAADPGMLAACLGDIQAVIHAAALSSAWGRWKAFHAANVIGTENALKIAKYAGASRFVFISSPSILFRFADQLDLDESAAFPRPVNAYARSKQIGEEIVRAQKEFSTITLRPRAIYGRGDKALLPRLIRAAANGPLPLLRDGKAQTNLTYVEDVARAVQAALEADRPPANALYHIAGSEQLSLTDIIEKTAARANVAVRWRKLPWPLANVIGHTAELAARFTPNMPEPAITRYGLGVLAFSQTLDIGAAKRDLGFWPEVTFEEGLERTFSGSLEP